MKWCLVSQERTAWSFAASMESINAHFIFCYLIHHHFTYREGLWCSLVCRLDFWSSSLTTPVAWSTSLWYDLSCHTHQTLQNARTKIVKGMVKAQYIQNFSDTVFCTASSELVDHSKKVMLKSVCNYKIRNMFAIWRGNFLPPYMCQVEKRQSLEPGFSWRLSRAHWTRRSWHWVSCQSEPWKSTAEMNLLAKELQKPKQRKNCSSTNHIDLRLDALS